MINRLLTFTDIMTMATQEMPGQYDIGEDMGLTKLTHRPSGKSVSFSTEDRLMAPQQFHQKVLAPLIRTIGDSERAAVSRIVTERGSTHGDFRTLSTTIQGLKDTMRVSHNWTSLHPGQKESLELIATKIGRILTGDFNFEDHWRDGSGYFIKGAEVCAAYKPKE